MFYNVFITLSVLHATAILGSTEPLSSKQEDVAPSSHYNSRIVGGDFAYIEDHPYMASYNVTFEDETSYCCGAIVTNQFVVTAAHCVNAIEDPSVLKIGVGSSDRTKGTIVQVLDIIIHPNYFQEYADEPDTSFDVAVLKTEKIEFSDTVRPIKLPDPDTDVSEYVTVTGWGLRELGGSEPKHLMVVELMTLDNDYCQSTYYKMFTMEMFCAGGLMEGVCSGDDGAPAVQDGLETDKVLEGITLFQRRCGSGIYPAIFIKLSAPPILEFLKNTIKD